MTGTAILPVALELIEAITVWSPPCDIFGHFVPTQTPYLSDVRLSVMITTNTEDSPTYVAALILRLPFLLQTNIAEEDKGAYVARLNALHIVEDIVTLVDFSVRQRKTTLTRIFPKLLSKLFIANPGLLPLLHSNHSLKGYLQESEVEDWLSRCVEKDTALDQAGHFVLGYLYEKQCQYNLAMHHYLDFLLILSGNLISGKSCWRKIVWPNKILLGVGLFGVKFYINCSEEL